MNLKQLFADDRAVSPVIGVILMVAITVILAAVIGTFVLGLGSGLNQAPQVQMDFEYNDSDGVTVTHQGGAELSSETISVTESGNNESISINDADAPFTAGDTIASGSYDGGETISIVWSSPDGSSSQIIGESTAPNN